MKDPVLERLRELTGALPGTREVASWGHPNFRTEDRIYCAYHPDRNGAATIWIRIDPLAVEVLRGDARIRSSLHSRLGWLGLRAEGRIDWSFTRQLIQDAHALGLPKPKPVRVSTTKRGAARSRAVPGRAGKRR